MKSPGIYQIQSIKKPERSYIGSSSNVYRRWQGHISQLKRNIHHAQKLQRHFNKYGETDLRFSLLLGCDKDDLIKLEQYFLDSYKPYFNNLLQAKPVKYIPHREDVKEKMRQSRLGHKLSEETKAKISKSHMGIKPSAETIEKLRIAQLGKIRPHTKEQIEKIRASNKGQKRSEETKRKLSEIHKGKPAWNKGRRFIDGKYILADAS
jgi:group I intron endonuclease